MKEKELGTIQFLDASSGEEAIAIIRAGEGRIGLCISLRTGGEAQVFLRVEDCEDLVDALRQAIVMARG